MEEESLRIAKFDGIPSAGEFASLIEPKNVPAVFNGCIKNWKAFRKWNPSNGGLDYLQGLAGSSIVEAMLSKSAPVFYGDIRSHERVPLAFSSFIEYCKQLYHNSNEDHALCSKLENHGMARSETEEESPQQIYLAQVPIMNIKNEGRVQMESMREDIEMPAFLETKALASINLWMNSAPARSSTHYDPHHNLLCVVTGCKQVVLWPPAASPLLYPMPLYGEASNHSAVAIEKPDLAVHPRAERSMEHSQRVILYAGDALFIPEGWFHQVDSDSITIAVNFWWQSDMMSSISEHMDAYYLRRILKRLTDKEMNQMLHKASTCESENPSNQTSDESSDNMIETNCIRGSEGNKLNQGTLLHELEPFALQSLHKLISLVHERVNSADLTHEVPSASETISAAVEKEVSKKFGTSFEYNLEDDPVADILWTLQPLTLQKMFFCMAQHFPRTLEALMLHLLSPVGAEVLTRKFDEMDQLIVEEDRNKFYQIFYGVFDDQFAVMDKLLNGKESFAFQAFKNVLDQYLGV